MQKPHTLTTMAAAGALALVGVGGTAVAAPDDQEAVAPDVTGASVGLALGRDHVGATADDNGLHLGERGLAPGQTSTAPGLAGTTPGQSGTADDTEETEAPEPEDTGTDDTGTDDTGTDEPEAEEPEAPDVDLPEQASENAQPGGAKGRG